MSQDLAAVGVKRCQKEQPTEVSWTVGLLGFVLTPQTAVGQEPFPVRADVNQSQRRRYNSNSRDLRG